MSDRHSAASITLEAVAEGIIEAGWLVALAVTPLLFNPYSWRTFEPDKAALLQALAGLMVAAWLAKIAAGGRGWRPTVAAGPVARRPPRWLGIPLVAPAALIAVTIVVAGLLSVDRRLSWLGSYQRGHGVTVEIACIVVFLLVLGHLRTRSQWRRVVFAVVLASFPIALYGLLQHLGLDPIEWSSERQRVGSSLGNPVFLGAYLVMVGFVTLWALAERMAGLVARRPRDGAGDARRRRLEVVQAGVLLYVLAFQAIALILSQSRGPMLGMLAGGYVLLFVGSLLARGAAIDDATPLRGLRGLARHAWVLVLGCGIAGIAVLVVVNLPASPLAGVRNLPYVGRLGTVFDSQSRTARVRQLIWQGSYDLLRSGDPLLDAGGTPDGLHRWRRVVGYGPETFAFAFSRFESPELARIVGDGAIPDRAHNDSIQRLITTGLIGWSAWMIFFCAIFYHSVRWLGFASSAGRRRAFWITAAGSAVLGAAVPVALTGSVVLSGVGLSAGLVVGLLAFVAVTTLRGADPIAMGFREGLIVAILATAVAHFTELAFGIAVVSTGLILWVLAAVLVVAGERWLDQPAASAAGSQQPRRVGLQAGDRRDGSILSEAAAEGLAAGLVTAVVLVTSGYGFIANPASARSTGAVLAATLQGASGRGLTGVLWLLLLTWLVAATLARPAGRSERAGSRRPGFVTFLVASTVPPILFLILQASRLAADSRLQATGLGISGAIDHVSRHIEVFTVALLLLTVALGAAIAAPLSVTPARPGGRIRRVVAVTTAGVLAVVVTAAVIRPLRADTFSKYGGVVAELGHQRAGLDLLERATVLDPLEPMHQLSLGTAAVASAQRAADDAERSWFFGVAEAAFARARELAPLDPDHTQNLARLWALEAHEASDPGVRIELLNRARREYDTALRMRPAAVSLVVEAVGVLEALGEEDAAAARVEQALALGPLGSDATLQLASLYRTMADAARTAGDSVRERRALDRALWLLDRARTAEPDSRSVAAALAAVLARAGRLEEALEAYQLVLDRFGEDSRTHQAMALLELATGRPEPTLRHAERAVELAGDEERPDALRVLELVRASVIGVNR